MSLSHFIIGILSSAFFHLHFIICLFFIHILSSVFYHPHFVIHILSSAIRHPPPSSPQFTETRLQLELANEICKRKQQHNLYLRSLLNHKHQAEFFLLNEKIFEPSTTLVCFKCLAYAMQVNVSESSCLKLINHLFKLSLPSPSEHVIVIPALLTT